MKNKHKLLKAAFNKKGELLHSIEKDKDIPLPAAIQNVIAKEYHGWWLINDFFKIKHGIGKKDKERYKIIWKKEGTG